jgi:hypothetical protein
MRSSLEDKIVEMTFFKSVTAFCTFSGARPETSQGENQEKDQRFYQQVRMQLVPCTPYAKICFFSSNI